MKVLQKVIEKLPPLAWEKGERLYGILAALKRFDAHLVREDISFYRVLIEETEHELKDILRELVERNYITSKDSNDIQMVISYERQYNGWKRRDS